MKKDKPIQNYQDYLNLDLLLSAQKLESKKSGKEAHDEMLFIITHQVDREVMAKAISKINNFKGVVKETVYISIYE